MKLWFENANGKERVIANCENEQEVFAAIDKFIADTNARMIAANPNWTPFVHYYTRIWYTNGRTHYDVGSHTEFFHWEGKHNG